MELLKLLSESVNESSDEEDRKDDDLIVVNSDTSDEY